MWHMGQTWFSVFLSHRVPGAESQRPHSAVGQTVAPFPTFLSWKKSSFDSLFFTSQEKSHKTDSFLRIGCKESAAYRTGRPFMEKFSVSSDKLCKASVKDVEKE